MPGRLIDVPIESLPYIDEHSIEVHATPEQVWEALIATVREFGVRALNRLVARGLRCVPRERAGEAGRIGSTVPGFIVARSVPPAVLAMMGEHRFARYALVFQIGDREGSRPVRLSAETRAEFPGRSGSAYRALVIGTRGHVLATSSILRAVRRRAERG